MKNSYPASLITPAAAFEQASSPDKKIYDNPVAGITTKDSTVVNCSSNNHNNDTRVGIKFDNVSAGKYFALLYTCVHAGVSTAMEKPEKSAFL